MAQDYINIELDSHRNQLIQLELLLTAGMLAMALVTAIAGLFGMNLYSRQEGSYSVFLIVSPPFPCAPYQLFCSVFIALHPHARTCAKR